MKNLKKLLKQNSVVISIELAVAIFLSVLLTLFVIFPNFSAWQNSKDQNRQFKERLDKVSQNIQLVQQLDAVEIERLNTKLDRILPAEADALRFFNLAEVVAKASGMSLSAAQVASTQVIQPTAPPSGGNQTPTPSTGVGSGAAAQPAQGAATTGLELKISFTGPFVNLLKLIANFERADRAALIRSVTIAKAQESGAITAAITFNLPSSSSGGTGSAETPVLLTRQEIAALQQLVSNRTITSSPAKGPVGKIDPFK